MKFNVFPLVFFDFICLSTVAQMSDIITHGWQAQTQNPLKIFKHITDYLPMKKKDYPNFKRDSMLYSAAV